MFEDDQEALAAEYMLGTLSAEERNTPRPCGHSIGNSTRP